MANSRLTSHNGNRNSKSGNHSRSKKIRYAVVGLGYFAQDSALPAFENASRNSELAALVSGEADKLKKLAKKYEVDQTYSYEEYDKCLNSGQIDAVYIALPNHLHKEYAVGAARAGIHVLCEKPMAVTEKECEAMIRAAESSRVKLMIAYRLHFEKANLAAVELVQSGKLGQPKIFNSVFSQQVEEGNIRVQAVETGGGTLYDIGVYCINAARYLFRAEPIEVSAFASSDSEPRFRKAEEMTSVMMRFPDDRLATFTCSFGGAKVSSYRVVGTKGDLRVEPAYDSAADLKHYLTLNRKTRERVFPKRDQFAPQLLYFSDCIQRDRKPEPSGEEGLIDITIVRALYRSIASGRPVKVGPFEHKDRPTLAQEISRPPVKEPELIGAESPSGK